MDIKKLEQTAYTFLANRENIYSRQIQQELANTLTNIYGEMKKIYNKFAVNGLLTNLVRLTLPRQHTPSSGSVISPHGLTQSIS